jgi:hypothetical protein
LPQAAEKRVPPTREDQQAWFEAQLRIAVELKLPVLLHERESHAEFMRIVKQHRDGLLADGVAINCFSGDAAQLKAFTEELNAYVVITGLLCNLERSVDTTAALTATPALDRLLVGSDAPYLTPFTMGAPFPKCNVPETLPHVVARIAEITRCDVATLCDDADAQRAQSVSPADAAALALGARRQRRVGDARAQHVSAADAREARAEEAQGQGERAARGRERERCVALQPQILSRERQGALDSREAAGDARQGAV